MGPRNNEKDLKCLFDFEFNWIDGFSFLAQFTSLKLSRSLSPSSPVKLSLCLKYVHWFKICFTSTMLRRLSIVKTSLSDEFVTRPWRFGPGDDFDGAHTLVFIIIKWLKITHDFNVYKDWIWIKCEMFTQNSFLLSLWNSCPGKFVCFCRWL